MNILRLLVPNFFVKEPIPPITNPDLQAAILMIKRQPTALQAMQAGMELLSRKYESKRFQLLLQFWKIWEKDPNKLWARTGIMHCTQLNYLLRVLLVKGNKIQDTHIELGYSLVWYVSPHQFLIVKYKGNDIALDPWNYDLGAYLNTFASGFGFKQLA